MSANTCVSLGIARARKTTSSSFPARTERSFRKCPCLNTIGPGPLSFEVESLPAVGQVSWMDLGAEVFAGLSLGWKSVFSAETAWPYTESLGFGHC